MLLPARARPFHLSIYRPLFLHVGQSFPRRFFGGLFIFRDGLGGAVWLQLESRLTNHVLAAGGAATVNVTEYTSTCT